MPGKSTSDNTLGLPDLSVYLDAANNIDWSAPILADVYVFENAYSDKVGPIDLSKFISKSGKKFVDISNDLNFEVYQISKLGTSNRGTEIKEFQIYNVSKTPSYPNTVAPSTPSSALTQLPTFSYDQIAEQLTSHFWQDFWGPNASVPMAFDPGPDYALTVNISTLAENSQQLARWALDAWGTMIGLSFIETDSASAEIVFGDNAEGIVAQAAPWSLSGNTIQRSTVTISQDWIEAYGNTIDSFSFQTYVHEIGHALGLGHAGNYNGSVNFQSDGTGSNHYLNDSVQASVMSYFNQAQNTFIDASVAMVVSPMIADIIAIGQGYSNLFDTTAANNGNTIWGANSNLDGFYGTLFGQIFGEDPPDSSVYSGGAVALTIRDTGGIDTIDLSPATQNQIINLQPESISDAIGLSGNFLIARDTVIENAKLGGGDDTIIGNDASNLIDGGAGTDTFVLQSIARADATIEVISGGYRVQSDEGVDELYSVEYIEFRDQTLELPVTDIEDHDLIVSCADLFSSKDNFAFAPVNGKDLDEFDVDHEDLHNAESSKSLLYKGIYSYNESGGLEDDETQVSHIGVIDSIIPLERSDNDVRIGMKVHNGKSINLRIEEWGELWSDASRKEFELSEISENLSSGYTDFRDSHGDRENIGASLLELDNRLFITSAFPKSTYQEFAQIKIVSESSEEIEYVGFQESLTQEDILGLF